MLQTPSEQEKLLLKIPEVIAEELDLEGTVATASEKAEVSACSPNSILRASSDVSSTDASGVLSYFQSLLDMSGRSHELLLWL